MNNHGGVRMIPNNQLSPVPQPSEWLYPHPSEYNPHVDYCMGGADIGDTSQGLDVQMWQLSYSPITGDLTLGKVGENGEVIKNIKGVKKISLAFDVNMRPCYVLEFSDKCELTYYDTVSNSEITQAFTNMTSPYLTLDDRRHQNSHNADVILSYINGDKLCIRNQRDRYAIEHKLTTLDDNQYTIERVGMAKNLRVQFHLSYWQEIQGED